MSSHCPYCNNNLSKTPQRKTKCPNCNNFIYVRTDPHTQKKVLLTEDGVKKIEKEWEIRNDVSHALKELKEYGYTEKTLETYRKKYNNLSDLDLIEKMYQDAITPTGTWGLYFNFALFLFKHNKSFLDPLSKAREIELKKTCRVVDHVQLIAAPDACSYCKGMDRKVFLANEIQETPVLPHKECSNNPNSNKEGFCRCTYAPYIPPLKIKHI